jgi:hypothetical protein
MGMFLLGALWAWFLVSFIEEYTHICGVLEFPMIVMNVIVEIIIFPFVLFWCVFLRHTIKPVDSEAVEKANIWEDSKHLFGSVYICFDWKAKRLSNKIFLFKVKPPVISDKADSPEFFRIGVDN